MKKILLPLSTSATQFYINQVYINYLTEAGYFPLAVFSNTLEEGIAQLCEIADGLLLPGGGDIDPIHYGEPNQSSYKSNPAKDHFERTLFHLIKSQNKPIFGICRGFQLIFRELIRHKPEYGDIFSYEQHINKHDGPASVDIMRTIPYHDIVSNTKLLWNHGDQKKLNTNWVNSMHHQGVTISEEDLFEKKADKKQKATSIKVNTRFDDLTVLAYTDFGISPKRKCVVLEAIDINWDGSRIRGVQWHPEELNDVILLQTFFEDQKRKEAIK